MKTAVLTALLTGLIFSGVALAEETRSAPCHNHCASCSSAQHQGASDSGGTFKPLFPEYDFKAPLGG